MKKMKYSVVTGVASLALCAVLVAPVCAKDFVANIFFPDTHPIAKYSYIQWAKDIEQASGGKLKAQVFTGTVLLEPRAGLSGVRDGIAQIGHHAAIYTPSDLPESNALQELSFTLSDPLVTIAAISEFNMTDAQMLAQWQQAGVIYTGGYSTPPYSIMCTEPVHSMEEIKGKKLRTAGAAVSRWVKAVGAVPVNVPSSEMYTGLEKGSLDCATNVISDLKSRSLWDVAKYATEMNLGMYWSGPNWGINPGFWKDLSLDEKKIIFAANAKAMANLYVGYQAAVAAALEEAKAHGVTIMKPSADLDASIQEFAKSNLEEVYKTARDKYKVKDPEALVGRFLKVVDKWEKLFANIDRKDAAAIAAIIQSNLYDHIDLNTFAMK